MQQSGDQGGAESPIHVEDEREAMTSEELPAPDGEPEEPSEATRLTPADLGVRGELTRPQRAVLVGVHEQGGRERAVRSLQELAALCDTAGVDVVGGVLQQRAHPDPSTYVGKGKVEEIRGDVQAYGATTVVTDDELSPGQAYNLEGRVHVPVVDRTAVILDIFAQHATSREGATQVELAQLSYLLPRLTGHGREMEQQGGGIGTRFGPGETKLETDRRKIRTRISRLKRDLDQVQATREVTRQQRKNSGIPRVALVGYTNAGKSSVMRRATGSEVLVADQLFATLDPTVRRARTPEGRVFTLSDTVGFVSRLPHQLVEAFHSTLEEVRDADLLVHVVDVSDPDHAERTSVVRSVLAEIGAGDVPEIMVANKVDLVPEERERLRRGGYVPVSAVTGEGIEDLLREVGRNAAGLVEVDVTIPYTKGSLVSELHEDGEVLVEEHTETGTHVHALVRPELEARLLSAAE